MANTVFYAAKRIPLSIFMQTMLRSQVGTFVGPNGLRFYRCAISQVNHEKQTVHGLWRGMPVAYDIANWSPNVKVHPGSYMHAPLDKSELVEYMMCLSGHMYPIWVPGNIKRGDELLFDEMRKVGSATVQEVHFLY